MDGDEGGAARLLDREMDNRRLWDIELPGLHSSREWHSKLRVSFIHFAPLPYRDAVPQNSLEIINLSGEAKRDVCTRKFTILNIDISWTCCAAVTERYRGLMRGLYWKNIMNRPFLVRFCTASDCRCSLLSFFRHFSASSYFFFIIPPFAG